MKMGRVRSWKVDLGRVLAGGLGSVVALTVAGWPGDAAVAAWVGLGGLVVGLLVAFGAEYVLRLRSEVRRLQHIERTNEHERKLREQERELWEYQVQLARREAAIAQVGTEVWGGAYAELAKAGHPVLPVSALLARIDNLQTARNLKHPLMPPGQQQQAKRAA